MKLRLLIKGDAIQYGENDFYCPCRTIDIKVADNLIDKEHEHIIGVEVEPQESDHKYHTCKHYTSGEHDGSCGSYICKEYSNWESEDKDGNNI